jgi:recombination DNA repair RAD52 pathway protein
MMSETMIGETTRAKLTDEQRRELGRPIPASAIHQKQGLDYVRGGWVSARLNDILGPEGWSLETVRLERFGDHDKPRAMATVRITLASGVYREGSGCGTGTGYDGWHQAVGEAETDAFKRAAARLGNALGGMLYLDTDDPHRVDEGDHQEREAHVAEVAAAHVAEVAAAYDSAATVEQGRAASRLARQLGVTGDPRVRSARESAAQRIRGAQRQGDE